jgi:hypothetical protein
VSVAVRANVHVVAAAVISSDDVVGRGLIIHCFVLSLLLSKCMGNIDETTFGLVVIAAIAIGVVRVFILLAIL